MRGWHFVGKTLRDGRPIPKDGVWLEHNGPLEMCESGLHFSKTPWNALNYAPGHTLCLVECGGRFLHDTDKSVCTKRKIIVRMDAEEMLRYFARMQALSVIHLWDAPQVMCDYLMTGDKDLLDAALGAALGAAWDSTGAATRDARGAAWDAAWAATGGAAGAAARNAAGAAAENQFNTLVYECFEDWL